MGRAAKCAGCACYAGCVHEEVERCGAIVRRAGAAATAQSGAHSPHFAGCGQLTPRATVEAVRGVASMQVIRSSIVGMSREVRDARGSRVHRGPGGRQPVPAHQSAGRGAVAAQARITPMLGLDVHAAGGGVWPARDAGSADSRRPRTGCALGRRGALRLPIAARSSSRCSGWFGHPSGEDSDVGRSILLSGEEPWRRVSRLYGPAGTELPERLLVALKTGQAAGCDTRGRQSAALRVQRRAGVPLVRRARERTS